jgi:uncharacterized Zn-finger protein
MKKKYEKYCSACGKTYESDTPENDEEVQLEKDVKNELHGPQYEETSIEEDILETVVKIKDEEIIDAEYEQGVADAEANEEPRVYKQMQGKKWTGNQDYMNDYIPSIDIKDIGKDK